MTLKAFNSENLRKRLEKLNRKQQLAFGVLCCQRLVPNYQAFVYDTGWGDSKFIRIGLEYTWSCLAGNKLNSQEIKSIIDQCESVIPDSDDFDSLFTSFAQDACFAVCGLLDYLSVSDTNKIVQAASYSIDSVDLYVQEIECMSHSDCDLEEKILNHQLMQKELKQQEENLSLIEETEFTSSNLLQKLKESWDNNGKSNLDLPENYGSGI